MDDEYTRRGFLLAGGAAVTGMALGPLVGGATGYAHDTSDDDDDDPWEKVEEILERIRPPRFPERNFLLTDYGAVGDGLTECTDAFRQAIEACHESGGGHVVVPAGAYLTGAIHLKSNVDLHVTKDATILFSTDPARYLPVVFTRFEGTECFNFSPFVYAYGQRNIGLTGEGTLDGQGPKGPWSSWGGGGADRDALRAAGHLGTPVEQRVFGEGHKLRPNMVQFYRCTNVLIDGLTIVNPAMWTMHPVLCRNVTIRDVTVHSTNSQGDGCDPEASNYVHITGCRFDTNDDCVAVKAGRDEDGTRVGVPSQNIVIEHCRFSGRWGGVTIGSEMSGGVRNVFARHCVINSPDFPGHFPVKFALYIKTNKLRGGVIEGVHLRDFTGQGLERDAIFITLNYNGGEGGTKPVAVRDISVDRMTIQGARAAMLLDGIETDHIVGVRISRSTFAGIANPNTIRFTDDLTFTDVLINGVPAT